MEYRVNRRTNDKISVIGIGTSYIGDASEKEGKEIRSLAFENGVNFADLAAGRAEAFKPFSVLRDVRDKMIYQIHFGADYTKGAYRRSYKLDDVKRSIDWQLKTLKTDYIDYGFIHCFDDVKVWEEYKKNGVFDYIKQLKEQKVVRHIGLSSHTVPVAQKIMDEADPDQLMFSLNAAYDYSKGDMTSGTNDERLALYRRCRANGVGITVMKTFAGGQLLDEKRSPFKKALNPYRCLQYVLDKPGVLTAVLGVQTVEEMKEMLGFFTASPEERDYSVISGLEPESVKGKCVYCNHCAPCPVGIDIATVNKYYDLALNGDDMAKDHYLNLSKTAADCVGCGHCDSVCPFRVRQSRRMKEIKEYFGK